MFGLKKFLEGAAAQVNPFDGGKTFQSVQQQPQQIQQRQEMNTLDASAPRYKAFAGGRETRGQFPRMLKTEDGSSVRPSFYAGESSDNRVTNQMVNAGRLPRAQEETYSADNLITNRMVDQGQLPESSREIYQNPDPLKYQLRSRMGY